MAQTSNRPVPVRSLQTQPFWDGCAREELLLQQCKLPHVLAPAQSGPAIELLGDPGGPPGPPARHYVCDVGLSGSSSASMILNAVAALHAGFCTSVVTLEDYGFCQKGEGGAFVEGGRIELGGELPLNTGGGLLSQGHASGFLHITETATQLRGAAGDRQVADARVGIVSGQCGTLGINACLLLGNEQG